MKAAAARFVLFSLILCTLGVYWCGRLTWYLINIIRKRPSGTSVPARIAIIGSFHNLGWLHAHIDPLIQCGNIDEVLVLCDNPINLGRENVSFHCPSPRLSSILGRNLARVITLLQTGLRYRPHIYMGYHIMPNGPLALMAAGLFNGKAIYQMTGGPIQVIHGGYQSENPLLRATGSPSQIQEKLVFTLVRQFDAVIVRGSKAKDFISRNQLSKNCFVITGAIDTERFRPGSMKKDIDVLFVGRLVEFKGLDKLLEVLESLHTIKPDFRASIVGEGPLGQSLEELARKAELLDNVLFHGNLEDVSTILKRSKIFIMLSLNEGMSIAMLEAMAAGVPPIVTNVGDLGDALKNRDNGILIDNVEPNKVATDIAEMLNDADLLLQRSEAARATIIQQFGMQAITTRWQEEIKSLLQ